MFGFFQKLLGKTTQPESNHLVPGGTVDDGDTGEPFADSWLGVDSDFDNDVGPGSPFFYEEDDGGLDLDLDLDFDI